MDDVRAASEWENDSWTEDPIDDDVETKAFYANLPTLTGMVFPASVLVGDAFWVLDWPWDGDTDGMEKT